jgi:hypothetical protein
MEAMKCAVQEINVPLLEGIPVDRGSGHMRVLVCQMGGCASPKLREFKIAAVEKLMKKYDINLCVFMEINYN